jgi:hypothetical protein
MIPAPPCTKLPVSAPSEIIKEQKPTSVVYVQYYQEQVNLAQYKLAELKQMAKHNKLTQCGAKSVLIEKLKTWFESNRCAVQIQKRIRGGFVRQTLDTCKRGAGFRDRSICLNETDFYTMEPIHEVPFQQFFSYTDEANFTYGFDIHSLITLQRKKGSICNPYNRNEIPMDVQQNIVLLYRLIRVVFPAFALEKDDEFDSPVQVRRRRRRRRTVTPVAMAMANTLTTFTLNRYVTTSITLLSTGMSTDMTVLEIMRLVEGRQTLLAEVRVKPTLTRIQELFMEMDQLGNYTDALWMSNLTVLSLHSMYRHLMDIWRFRAQISYDAKHRICPVEDPFTSIGPGSDQDLDFMRRLCLGAMENMVFSGLDVEFRKLGAMHVLTALTVVSTPARNTFFWLYESMF